jgi:hypothetical protein
MGAGAAALALDISQLRTRDFDELADAGEGGLGLMFGIPERFRATPAQAADSVAEVWRKMALPAAQCARQVVVTPGCGLARESPAGAREALRRCREAARILPELMGDLWLDWTGRGSGTPS